MKCIVKSAKHGDIIEKAPYFGICDYIKVGKVREYWSGISIADDKRRFYNVSYIEGDANFIFEKLKEISDIIKNDKFILTFRDDGDIEAMIYDDYIE